jgi:hypothetical protein
VVVEGRRDEVGQRLAAEGDGDEAGAQGFDGGNRQLAPLEFMAYPLDDGAVRCVFRPRK